MKRTRKIKPQTVGITKNTAQITGIADSGTSNDGVTNDKAVNVTLYQCWLCLTSLVLWDGSPHCGICFAMRPSTNTVQKIYMVLYFVGKLECTATFSWFEPMSILSMGTGSTATVQGSDVAAGRRDLLYIVIVSVTFYRTKHHAPS